MQKERQFRVWLRINPRLDSRKHLIMLANRVQRSITSVRFLPTERGNLNHTTEECKKFQKLPISGKNGKYQLLKEINACYKCFGNHLRQNCPSNVRCNCDSTHHHKMLCDAKPRSDYPNEEEVKGDKKGTYVAQSDSLSLYPIYQVLVSGCNKSVTVFCDGGSNASYITHRAAQRINA